MTQWGNWVPFDDVMAKLGALDAMENWKDHNYVMEKLGALDGAIENLGESWSRHCGEIGTLDDAMGKLGHLDDLMGKLGPCILFK